MDTGSDPRVEPPSIAAVVSMLGQTRRIFGDAHRIFGSVARRSLDSELTGYAHLAESETLNVLNALAMVRFIPLAPTLVLLSPRRLTWREKGIAVWRVLRG